MGQPFEDTREADGHHDYRYDGLSDKRSQHHSLDNDSQQACEGKSYDKGHRKRCGNLSHDTEADESPQRHEFPGGKVEDARGLVNQDESQSDQPINPTCGQAANYNLEERCPPYLPLPTSLGHPTVVALSILISVPLPTCRVLRISRPQRIVVVRLGMTLNLCVSMLETAEISKWGKHCIVSMQILYFDGMLPCRGN